MLNQSQIQQYQQEGYLLLQDFFSASELDAVETDINQLVDDLAVKLKARGKIKHLHRDKGFSSRLIALDQNQRILQVREFAIQKFAR